MQIKGATRVTGAIVGHVDKGYSGANSSLNLPPSLLTWVPVTWQPLQWASSFTKQTSSPSSRSSAKSNPTPKKGENKVVTKKAKLSDDGKSEATAQSSATTTAARKVAAELSNEDIDELRDLAEEAIKELHQYFRIIIMNRGRGAEMAISFREVRYSADAWGIDEGEDSPHYRCSARGNK